MNRGLFAAVAFVVATPLIAQSAAPAAGAAPATAAPAAAPVKVVAMINGEVLTKEQFDILWDRVGAQLKRQYEQTGGKPAFLENYVKKRLLVQEAYKVGFNNRPDVRGDMEASAEATLFDRYVRDVVAQDIVTEKEIRDYYNANPTQFATPEMVKVRHIVMTAQNVGPRRKTKEEARQRLGEVAGELFAYIPATGVKTDAQKQALLIRFQEAARKYSEDGVAEVGGDLGWTGRGALDAKFEEVAFGLEPGTMSGIVETPFGYHLILTEGKRAAGIESFEESRSSIREFLMTRKAAEVMNAVTRLTNELRMQSKIGMYPENLE